LLNNFVNFCYSLSLSKNYSKSWKIWLVSKELEKEIKFLFLRNIIVFGRGIIFIFFFLKLLFEKIINRLKELKEGIDEVKKEI